MRTLYYDFFKENNREYLIVVSDKGLFHLTTKGFNDNNKYKLVKDEVKTSKYIDQLKEYFGGKRKVFTLPLDLEGTDFELSVWNELLKIPFGKTVSYIDVAKELGDTKKTRAVAGAIGRNPVMIVVPCHRVIGKNKKLTGYSEGLDVKEELLRLEGITDYRI
ncbi:methylated-DNA--[protein]-cysteine S-methyltransferase [Haploplasma axanthum]|uniref:methylated-DNA--[protein]-cysteine S-methyltransferase n=1 Tax=Haploplasma axanthum TaxID=29552 RepID=A0A449BFR9_HAPAX|nr:methylated-DNA--[protein]-cysteine S-methyltransferase [Haploplasma axanthum]VEU81299.1 Methylated-DNA--protein-cysteine methyltransferase, inducible [Haploplasma axanthum]